MTSYRKRRPLQEPPSHLLLLLHHPELPVLTRRPQRPQRRNRQQRRSFESLSR
jgi:hypothetical protein